MNFRVSSSRSRSAVFFLSSFGGEGRPVLRSAFDEGGGEEAVLPPRPFNCSGVSPHPAFRKHHRRQLLPPQREPSPSESVPDCLRKQKRKSRPARAENGASHDITRIMHTIIYPREGNHRGRRRHEAPSAAIENEANHRRGK